jgi:hypothetical protein
MGSEGDALPPHRQLVWYLESALDCLDEAHEADAYLPYWAAQAVRRMVEDLESLLERVAREVPALAPIGDDELGDDAP